MYVVLYDHQIDRLSFDKHWTNIHPLSNSKNDHNDIDSNISKVLINEGSMFDYENIIL